MVYSRWMALVGRKEGHTWQHWRGEEDPDREEEVMDKERKDMVDGMGSFHLQDTHEETVEQRVLPILEMVESLISRKNRGRVVEVGFIFPSIFSG